MARFLVEAWRADIVRSLLDQADHVWGLEVRADRADKRSTARRGELSCGLCFKLF